MTFYSVAFCSTPFQNEIRSHSAQTVSFLRRHGDEFDRLNGFSVVRLQRRQRLLVLAVPGHMELVVGGDPLSSSGVVPAFFAEQWEYRGHCVEAGFLRFTHLRLKIPTLQRQSKTKYSNCL